MPEDKLPPISATQDLASSAETLENAKHLNLTEAPELLQPLSEIRQALGMSPEAASSALRLNLSQILALEQQHWEKLPGPAYIKGFLRSYCKLLHTDAQPYVDRYIRFNAKQESDLQVELNPQPSPMVIKPLAAETLAEVKGEPQSLASYDNGEEARAQKLQIFKLAFGLIFITLIFILFWERQLWLPPIKQTMQTWFPVDRTVSTQNAALPQPTIVVPLSESTMTASPIAISESEQRQSDSKLSVAPSETSVSRMKLESKSQAVTIVPATSSPLAGAGSKQLKLSFKHAVWLELRDKTGVAIVTGMHKPNTVLEYKVDPPMLLIVGAAHAVDVVLGGQAFDLAPHTVANVAKVKIQ